jgi:hypothetical protein
MLLVDIRPSWPNSDISKGNQARNELTSSERAATDINLPTSYDSKDNEWKIQDEVEIQDGQHTCSNCHTLVIQNQILREEKQEVEEGLAQALDIIEGTINDHGLNTLSSNSNTQPQTTMDRIVDKEVPLLFRPLQEEMASIFKQKETKVWLTIRVDTNTANILDIFLGRKSQGRTLGQSIMTSYV